MESIFIAGELLVADELFVMSLDVTREDVVRFSKEKASLFDGLSSGSGDGSFEEGAGQAFESVTMLDGKKLRSGRELKLFSRGTS